jgi:hypothetical protein
MGQEFEYDVFLSHSAKDKVVVRPLAERLRQDGLKVWFGEWVLKPGDNFPAKIDPPSLRGYGGTGEGLERSRVLVLCLSPAALGSDWVGLACPTEASERRRKRSPELFRDAVNAGRRFIPLLTTTQT